MSLLWIEGFEGYGTVTGSGNAVEGLMSRRYAALTSIGHQYLAAGRFSGYSLQGTGNYGACCLQTPALTTNATLVIGMAAKWSSLGGDNTYDYCQFYDGTTQGICLQPATAEIGVYRGSTLLGTTSGAGIAINTWYYVELKVYCHATLGTVEVRVNGVTKLSLTAQNTKAGTDGFYDRVRFGSGGGGGTLGNYLIDDVYILDGAGSVNNNFLGNHKVVAVVPNGDASTQLTTSSGATHYNLLSENPSDDDTSYVQGTTGQADLYTYTGLPPVTSIAGVQITTTCRESADSVHNLITPVISNGVESDDAGQIIGASGYVDRRRIVELDPATSAAWTLTGLGAAQIGVKVG
jgi:hypothetical protein